MKRRTLRFPALLAPALLATMLAGAVPPMHAQEAPGATDEEGRAVARLSLMNGEVSVRRGDSGDWVAGAINAPLMTEDRVFAGPRSRAEVQFDYYHRIRLAEDTEVRLADIENGRYLLQLARGTATFAALKGGDAQVEISTPAAAVRPVAYGSYRVTVQPDGTAEITVRSGEAEIYTPSGTQRLKAGRTMLVRNGENGEPVFQTVAALGRDDWDRFNEARDKELRRGLETYRYVSRDVYGAEDLYGHGEWVNVAPYGHVWQPNVAIGWAPYRYGRWSWVDWYGWTWVSYDPWGWAPYHYGRWFHHGGRWCWYPGAYMGVRHRWSPALVAWFGWGGGGVGIGFGGGWGRMGWVPLAPYDPFHRWWGRDYYRGYRNGNIRNNVVVVNNVNITNVYRNARVRDSISIHDGDFSRGGRGQAYRGNADDLGRASVMRGALPVSPGRESVRFAERDARVVPVARNASGGNERFYARTAARQVDRVPFDRQREALAGGDRRVPGEPGEGAVAGRGSASPRGGAEGRTGGIVGTEAGRGGWRTVGEAETGRERTGSPRTAEDGTSGRSGWRGFGDPSGVRTGGEAAGARTGRNAEAGRGGEAAATEPRSGWRGFGDPNRGTRGEVTTRGAESPRGGDAGEGRRGVWSTRGSDGGAERMDRGSTRTDSGRSEDSGRGGIWSTRGGSERAPSAPSRVESPRSESPRSESPRMESSPRSEPSRNEAPSRSESPRTGGRGRGNSDDMAGAFSGAPASSSRGFVTSGRGERWSTGGGSGVEPSARSYGSSPRSSEGRGIWSTGAGREYGGDAAVSGGRSEARTGSEGGGRGVWSTGAGRGDSGGRMESTPRSEPRSSGGGGIWSTGRSEASMGRSEPYGGGMSAPRSMPSTRSMEGRSYGGGGAPSMSPRSSGGFGGGGGSIGSGRSGGFGGGGIVGSGRSGGGSVGGSGRMSGGGGGRSSGGGGRSSGGRQ